MRGRERERVRRRERERRRGRERKIESHTKAIRLTRADHPSVFIVLAVVDCQSEVRAEKQRALCSLTLHVVEPHNTSALSK